MGKQSARMYFNGKDHKDIYFQGHYHDQMYKGSLLVWEKLKSDITWKAYTDYFKKPVSLFAENGSVAMLAYVDDEYYYLTEDFETFNKVYLDSHEISDTLTVQERIVNMFSLDGYIYFFTKCLNSSETHYDYFFYRTRDGISKEEVTKTFHFSTNGFKGTLKLSGYGYKDGFYPRITVCNNHMFAPIEKATDEYVDRSSYELNDYEHLLRGTYISDDGINWTALCVDYYRRSETYIYVYAPYSFSEVVYKNGNYYAQCTHEWMKEDSTWWTTPQFCKINHTFSKFEVLYDEANLGVKNVGDYFYIYRRSGDTGPDKMLTKDFVNFESPAISLSKEIVYEYATPYGSHFATRYRLSVDASINNGIRYGNYTFCYVPARIYEKNLPNGTEYNNSCTALLVLDKGDYSNIIDVIWIITKYTNFETGEETDYAPIYMLSSSPHVFYITGKNKMVYYGSNSNTWIGIFIKQAGLEEQ